MTNILKDLEAGRKRKRVLSVVRTVFLICAAFAAVVTGAFFVRGYFGIYQVEPPPGVYTERPEPEAYETLYADDYMEEIPCGKSAEVTISFPGGVGLTITGEDVDVKYAVRPTAGVALAYERGHGFIVNTELLGALVAEFTEAFNQELSEDTARVYDENIVIIKGAGQVLAYEGDVFELAYDGLNESLSSGMPATRTFVLPDVQPDISRLERLREGIFLPALSAEFNPESGEISDCVVGVDIDIDKVLVTFSETQTGEPVTIDLIFTQPKMSREALEAMLFRDVIGETITYIAGSENRLNNIILSSEAIDGHILMPGEEFSFNQTVGIRTYERGYRPAPAFMGGQTVNVIGGGICQVSSSIFNAIMDSDILILERRPHGRPVAYLPVGRDATVSWGTIDFRFENNTEFPLRIDSDVNERELIVRVFGTIFESEY